MQNLALELGVLVIIGFNFLGFLWINAVFSEINRELETLADHIRDALEHLGRE